MGWPGRDKTERWTISPHGHTAPQVDTRRAFGVLVTHLPDVRYLCGFTGSSAALTVTRQGARLFTDGRYTAQAAEEVSAAQVQIVSASPAVASAVQWLAAQAGANSVGFDPEHGPAWRNWRDGRRRCRARLRKSFLTPVAAPLVEALRVVKDEDELRVMGEAALMGCRLFDHMLGFLRPGLMETEVAAELEYAGAAAGSRGNVV